MVLASHHTLYSGSCRLFWWGVCGCLPAQPLWACFYLHSQTKFLTWLHLRMWTELLWPVLWKQVRSLHSHPDLKNVPPLQITLIFSSCVSLLPFICYQPPGSFRATIIVCNLSLIAFVCLYVWEGERERNDHTIIIGAQPIVDFNIIMIVLSWKESIAESSATKVKYQHVNESVCLFHHNPDSSVN